MRPVESDRGERYESESAAARAMGCTHGAVRTAIAQGHRCGGRRWRYADLPPAEEGEPGGKWVRTAPWGRFEWRG